MKIYHFLALLFFTTPLIAQPIVSHYKSEEGGIFPTPKPEATPAGKEQVEAEVMRRMKILEGKTYPTPEIYKPEELFPCTKNKTTSDKREGMSAGEGLDLLFLNPDQIPPEAEVVLGATVRIVPYTKEVSLGTELAREFKVTCLPTRIRVVEAVLYRHEGENALRNFEKDPKFGDVHPFLKQLRRKK